MDLKLVSKNNMGIVITFILVILLSQSRFFDFLTETTLGRMFILLLIIFISYTNKFLGLLAVLFIIIAFNHYDTNVIQSYNYYEGFDVSGNSITSSIEKDNKEDIIKQNLEKIKQAKYYQTVTTTSSANSGIIPPTNTVGTNESFGGREGFCMTDRETNILRGKQSNTIPVFNNTRDQDDNVSPSEQSVFSSLYTSF